MTFFLCLWLSLSLCIYLSINTQSEQQKEKSTLRNEDNLRGLWDIKGTNIRLMGVQEGEEREQGIENIFEVIMTEKFLNLEKKIDTQAQKVQRLPNKINPKRPTPRHIKIKMLEV